MISGTVGATHLNKNLTIGQAIGMKNLTGTEEKREAVFFWNQAKDLAEPEDNIHENIIEKLENYYEG